jgi:hypothetical protein
MLCSNVIIRLVVFPCYHRLFVLYVKPAKTKGLIFLLNILQTIRRVEYQTDYFNDHPELHLNPDHSLFLLVDGGEKKTEQFRASLEEELNKCYPVISLLIDGGDSSFAQIRQTLEKGIPVFIFKGTGRFADILAKAVILLEKLG